VQANAEFPARIMARPAVERHLRRKLTGIASLDVRTKRGPSMWLKCSVGCVSLSLACARISKKVRFRRQP